MIGRVLGWLRGSERKAVDIESRLWAALLGETTSKAGTPVNLDTALRVMVVLACARVISEDVARLPFRLYVEGEDGRRVLAADHPVNRLLHWRPNGWMTSMEFREALSLHTVLTSNGYAVIVRVRGRPAELIPVVPGRVTVRQAANYELEYEVRSAGGVVDRIAQADMLHIRGPSWDGVVGMDVMRMARDAIGLAIAAENSQSGLHRNGAQPSGLLSTEAQLSPEAVKRLRDQWAQRHIGSENAGSVAVLDTGFKWTPLTMSGVDAQLLETRKFQIEEVCRAFRVQPQKVMHIVSTSTFASAEVFNTAHAVDTVGPWVERWEQAVDRCLLTDAERDGGYYSKIAIQALLRADVKSRAAFYQSGITTGWMTRNEARRLEDMDPIDGLDEPLAPLNMAPAAAGAGDDEGDGDAAA